MISAEVPKRVFKIKCGSSTGTCVVIDIDNRQYLCTAKHCLTEFEDDSIGILHENQWKQLEVRLVGYGSHGSDVCVLTSNSRLVGDGVPLSVSQNGIVYGQEAYFLGFPFGMQMDSMGLNRQFPFPFVKRATVSAFEVTDASVRTIYLDGHNNIGFSGGPVVIRPNGNPKAEWRVAAIIGGYRSDWAPVLGSNDVHTGDKVRVNTGIVIAYGIAHAVEAIHSNPIGFSLN